MREVVTGALVRKRIPNTESLPIGYKARLDPLRRDPGPSGISTRTRPRFVPKASGRKSSNENRTIKVDYLARVEGEGAMLVRIRNGRVADVKLKIFEPPRFFEAFLRGRSYLEAPDITAESAVSVQSRTR